MIELKNVSKYFGDQCVLKDINLTIPEGTIYGIVGINGAGKSTLLRLIAGVYSQSSGEILVDSKPVYENELVKKDFFFLSDDPFYTPTTTPRDLAKLMRTFYDVNEVTYFETLDYFKIPINKKMNRFSKGMKRQIFVSLAFAIRPKYLILDEAFDGLDPLARLRFRKEIISLCADLGTTVIISSHSLRELEDICDCFALIDKNTIVSSGSLSDALGKLHHYQIAIKEEFDIHLFPRIYKSIQKDGRVVHMVTELSMEETLEKIKDYNPVFIDELPMGFEEMFNSVVDEGGYLK